VRDYTGISINDVEDPRIRHKLGVIDYYLRDLTRGVGRIQQGLVPDGSGTSIINAAPLSDIYLVLLGRPTNQHGHGGTSPLGTLTLSSTTHPTKGFVYLGGAKQTAYDETNERIGIATAGPAAKLHIKVGDAAQQLLTTTAGAGNIDWGSFGGATSLNDAVTTSGDGKYDRWDASIGFNSPLTFTFPTAIDPGTDAGFVMNLVLRSTTIAVGETMQTKLFSGGTQVRFWDIGFNGNTFGGADFNVGTTFAATALTLTTAEAALLNFAQSWTLTMSVGGITTGQYDVDYVRLDVPSSGSTDALQKWESTSNSNTLIYGNDANSNKSLILQGQRAAVSASAWAMTVSTPSSGAVAASTDGIGTVQWASASSLATKLVHRWEANGPYRIDNDVDGPYIATRDGTLNRVLLYRRQGGTSGSTGVNLLKNGASVLSAVPSIASSAAASSTALAGIGTAAFSQGDRFTVSASAVDGGSPRDWTLEMEFF